MLTHVKLQEVLWRLYQVCGRWANVSNFALALYNDRRDRLDFPLVFQDDERVELPPIKPSASQGLVGRVLTTRQSLLIRDLPQAGITVETNPISPAQPVRSWLSVPVYHSAQGNGKARGVLALWSDQPGAFTGRQLELLRALVAQAALIMEAVRLAERTRVEQAQVMQAEEQARKALARDLHDGPLQLVSGIKMCLDFCRQALEKDPALLAGQFDEMRDLAEDAMRQMRSLLFELRPLVLETEGLGPAVQLFLERRRQENPAITLTLHVETWRADGQLSRQEARTEAALFAIIREAVNNALKHAQARTIRVCLQETPTALRMLVADDGQGFDAAEVLRDYEQRGSLGLVNMGERAEALGGRLSIHSAPGRGARIAVCVPVRTSA